MDDITNQPHNTSSLWNSWNYSSSNRISSSIEILTPTSSLMRNPNHREFQPTTTTATTSNQRFGPPTVPIRPTSPHDYLRSNSPNTNNHDPQLLTTHQYQQQSHQYDHLIQQHQELTVQRNIMSDHPLARPRPPKFSPFANSVQTPTQGLHASEESLSFGKSSVGQTGLSIDNEESSLSFGSRPLSQRSRSQSRSRSNTRVIRLASPNHSTHSSMISSVSWTVPGGVPPTLPRAPSSSPMTRRNPAELEVNGFHPDGTGIDTEAERRWLEHFCGGNWAKYRKKMRDKQPYANDAENDVLNIPFYFQSSEPGAAVRENEMTRLNGTVIIQRYLILESLGLGTCAIVYSAIDQRTGDRVAIKISQRNMDAFDQLLHEIHILDRLHKKSNKNITLFIPQLNDHFHWKGHLIAVFPLYGLDIYQLMLRDYTAQRVQMVIEVSKEILNILNEIHREGIVHCDIKPENIVRDRQKMGKYYLIDFGLARLECEATSYYIQTRSYRAPELLLHHPYNSKVDIWALGCVLVEMWTGKALMKGNSESEILQNVVRKFGNPSPYLFKHSPIDCTNLRSNPTFRDPKDYLETLGMPSIMINFLSKFMEWDPLNRWSAEQLLKHELLLPP